MMRNSIDTYKESLSRIAGDVQDAAEELEISGPRIGEDVAVSDRRISHRFAQSTSPMGSPFVNGINSGSSAEIEQHKAEIQRLQTSEAEIKALAVNYAAILKEKEEQLSRLHEENSSLRKSSEAKNAVAHVLRDENLKTLTNNSIMLKVTADQSPNRQQRYTSQVNSRSPGNNGHKGTIFKQDVSRNGGVQGLQATQFEGIQQKMDLKVTNSHGNDKELANELEENGRALTTVQVNHELEIKQLKAQLGNERENSANVERKFQEEHKQNESFWRELSDLKMEKETVVLNA